MVYISQAIINQLKEAKSEQEITLIIDKCISRFKIEPENGCMDKKYTRNILMALKYYKTQELEPKALENANIAIEIFKKLHAHGSENVW